MGESGYLILNFQIKFPWKFKWAFPDIYKYPETPLLNFHGNLEGRKRIFNFTSYCIPSSLVDWLGGFIIWHIWVCDFSFPEKWPPKHQSSGTKNEPPRRSLLPNLTTQKSSSLSHSWLITIKSSLEAAQKTYLSEFETWLPILQVQLRLAWFVHVVCICLYVYPCVAFYGCKTIEFSGIKMAWNENEMVFVYYEVPFPAMNEGHDLLEKAPSVN